MDITNREMRGRPVSVKFADQTLDFEYRYWMLDNIIYSQIKLAARTEDVTKMCSVLSYLILRWNMEEEGKTIEPTQDFLETLPVALLTNIVNGILISQAELAPSAQEPKKHPVLKGIVGIVRALQMVGRIPPT